ncbi:MAG: ribonuclease HI family protein [Elusimicrobiota bacterium]
MVRKVIVYFDGNKTPEGVSCSYVLIDEMSGKQKEETVKLPTETTVPQAEYYGLIRALSAFKKTDKIELEIYGDSELVVKQILGEWECKNTQLRILRSKARNLLNRFASWKLGWVPRTENKAR